MVLHKKTYRLTAIRRMVLLGKFVQRNFSTEVQCKHLIINQSELPEEVNTLSILFRNKHFPNHFMNLLLRQEATFLIKAIHFSEICTSFQ